MKRIYDRLNLCRIKTHYQGYNYQSRALCGCCWWKRTLSIRWMRLHCMRANRVLAVLLVGAIIENVVYAILFAGCMQKTPSSTEKNVVGRFGGACNKQHHWTTLNPLTNSYLQIVDARQQTVSQWPNSIGKTHIFQHNNTNENNLLCIFSMRYCSKFNNASNKHAMRWAHRIWYAYVFRHSLMRHRVRIFIPELRHRSTQTWLKCYRAGRR